ncbi:hypothetical protein EI94DRAFT_1803667 [Lactarius quietus]|nr:hypothetical protein EI94DRAFT_1803667 [Lactarius quietus]
MLSGVFAWASFSARIFFGIQSVHLLSVTAPDIDDDSSRHEQFEDAFEHGGVRGSLWQSTDLHRLRSHMGGLARWL